MFQHGPDISLFIAFAAGLLSFVSPCVLPLVPSYVTYITGLTLEELTSETERARVRCGLDALCRPDPADHSPVCQHDRVHADRYPTAHELLDGHRASPVYHRPCD